MAVVRFKAEDIWDAPDDDRRYEVIDGGLFVTPAPGWAHQIFLGNLYATLWNFVTQHGLGKVVVAPIGVVLDPETAVEPDLIYLSTARLNLVSERGVEGPPDLVVEVLSPSTRSQDLGIKMRRYAAAGISHYWTADPLLQTLKPYRLGEQGYALIGSFGHGSTFQPELFPGLEIHVDALWA